MLCRFCSPARRVDSEMGLLAFSPWMDGEWGQGEWARWVWRAGIGGCSRRTSQQYGWNVYTSLPPPVGKLCRNGGLRKRAPWNARPAFHLMWLSSLSSAQDAGADTQKGSWGSTVKIELVTVTGSSIFIYTWFLEEHIFTVHAKIDFC